MRVGSLGIGYGSGAMPYGARSDMGMPTVGVCSIGSEPVHGIDRLVADLNQSRTELRPGTLLTREWDGQLQRVMVLADRFSCRGEHASITDLAAADKINQSYVCRILRLSLLAWDIVEAILDGRQQSRMDLAMLMEPFPVDGWQTLAFQPIAQPIDLAA